MDPDRWERLNALFHQALERDPADRDAFLGEACVGDPALAAEVTALVAAHAGASVFDRPAYEADPDLPRDAGGTLVGHRLGPYQITSRSGEATWVSSISERTRGSTARSPSRRCPPRLRTTRSSVPASNARR